MKRHNYLLKVALFTFMLIGSTIFVDAGDTLFYKGASAYQIVIDAAASTPEKTAAKELQGYINQVGGPVLPISNDLNASGPKIFVGYNSAVAALTGVATGPSASDQSFTYKTIGKDIVIYGGSAHGTMYGVFDFLEKQLGIHWLTPDYTSIPKADSCMFDTLNVTEFPSIPYRYTNYYATENQPAWGAHNRENMKWNPTTSDYGIQTSFWAGTMVDFLNPDEFYKEHPEYFALRDGKRIDKYCQPCLSNPDVLRICKERMLKKIKDCPDYLMYNLAQNDNETYCECDNCKAIENKYGGHSGLILWFVNQVADTVKQVYPDKYVTTFAYQYTRTPPTGIVPRDNVVICVCDIECCFAHSLASGCSSENSSYISDLDGWQKIAPHLFIWDYIVNFSQYMAPWPNYHVLAPNIQTFHDHNTLGVFEEAPSEGHGGEFEEMKNWVVLKLLWNPKQSTDSLARVFIDNYYGKAAQKVYDYYTLCQSLVKAGTHMGIYIFHDNPIYTDAFIQQGTELLQEALDLADNEEIKARLELLNLQMVYMQCVRNPTGAAETGLWDEFYETCRKGYYWPAEGENIYTFVENYVRNWGFKFNPSVTNDYRICCKLDSGMVGVADSTAAVSDVCLKLKGDAAATWKVISYGSNNFFHLINASNGMALTDVGNKGDKQSKLTFALKNTSDSTQLWTLQYENDPHYFNLKNLYTGNFISNRDSVREDGHTLYGYHATTLKDSLADNNVWFLQRVGRAPLVPNPNYNYQFYSVNFYMGVRDSTAQQVVPCVKYSPGSQTAQQWALTKVGDCYKVANARLGTILTDRSNASVAVNALSLEKSVDGDSAQLWRIIWRKDYRFNMINAYTGHIMTYVYGINNYAITGQTQKVNDSTMNQRLWTFYMKPKSAVTGIQTVTALSSDELTFDSNTHLLSLNGTDVEQARVFGMNGIFLGNFNHDGTFSLKGFPLGIYIVRWQGRTLKIDIRN